MIKIINKIFLFLKLKRIKNLCKKFKTCKKNHVLLSLFKNILKDLT